MRKSILAAIALAVVVAACGDDGADPVVATVNGENVHESTVLDLRARPQDAVTTDAADFRQDLSEIILQEIVATSLLEEFGASVSRLDAEAELAANIDDASISMNEAIASLGEPDATEALLVHNAYSQLLIETATDELAAEDSFIEEALERYPTQITNVCVRHILVPDEIELEAVVNRLDAGEDFGAIADQVSLDTNTSGGDLGCSVASRYVEPFAAAVVEAPIGEPVYPIETQFGIHVVLVYERRVPTAEELRTGENDQELPFEVVQSAWADWFTEQVEAADVSVASRIGIWFTDPPSILPPD